MPTHLKTEYIRKGRPHFHHFGATFSITTLAADAVPAAALTKLRAQQEAALLNLDCEHPEQVELHKAAIYKQYNTLLEEMLNAKSEQEYPFRNPTAAQAVVDRLWQYAGRYYHLCAYAVMPNHLHLLLDFSIQLPENYNGLDPLPDYTNVSIVMNQIKGGSAYDINRSCPRQGPLWKPGYYDRYIRSHEHFLQAFWYILNNPVKANLVKEWNTHPFTYGDPQWL